MFSGKQPYWGIIEKWPNIIASVQNGNEIDLLKLGCLACFLTKIITDLEARRVFIRNQKLSREWGLLHNITWSTAGNSFANITYGGFTLITTLMLISRCIDSKSRPSMTEKIFLTVGMLCFFTMGAIVLAAFDQVPSELHDNSLILGALSFFVAFVMLFDLADPMARLVADTTQTETHFTTQETETDGLQNLQQTQSNSVDKIVSPLPNNTDSTEGASGARSANVQLHIEPNTSQHYRTESQLPSPDVDDFTKNGNYHRSDSFDFVHMQQLPRVQQPVFERVLMPEKKRPAVVKVPDPRASIARQEVVRQTSAPPMNYKNYAYDGDYGEEDLAPPRYASRVPTMTQHNRYRDLEDGGPPMMVIRDYSRQIPTSTYAYHPNQDNFGPYDNRQADQAQSACVNGTCGHQEHHRNNRNGAKQRKNNPIRPGFVANAAKMWDRRAAEKSGELNTIV